MNDNVRRWFSRNGIQVTWFLIGLLVAWGIDNLLHGNYISAAFNFGFAYLNYILNSR